MHRKRDTTKCFNQLEVTRKRDHDTGLSTIKYKISSVNELIIDNSAKVTLVNIKLNCNRSQTPWCDCNAKENVSKL